jgi:hypothetical protein
LFRPEYSGIGRSIIISNRKSIRRRESAGFILAGVCGTPAGKETVEVVDTGCHWGALLLFAVAQRQSQ